MSKLHVSLSALTNTIYCGSVLKDGRTWGPNKTDVTGEACASVALYVLARGGSTVVTENGTPKFEISVREIEASEGKR